MKTHWRKGLNSVIVWLFVLVLAVPSMALSQDAGGEALRVFRQEEPDQMLAPIALYPDSLLAQVLMASTYPLEEQRALFREQSELLKARQQKIEQQAKELDRMDRPLSQMGTVGAGAYQQPVAQTQPVPEHRGAEQQPCISNRDEARPEIESMTFLSKWSPAGKVTLSHGEHREPAAPGSASEIIVRLTDTRAFGTVNGRVGGAVVITTSAGGSGTFYDLALLVKGPDGWLNTDAVFLGDRVAVHSVDIRDDHVAIRMTVHGANDPMCCPTLDVVKRFAVSGGRFAPAAEREEQRAPMAITGTVWQWVKTRYNNDMKRSPAKPENYTVQFLEGGNITIKADCNLKGGTYSTEGNRLSIDITHSTMAACEAGSLEEPFARDLLAAAIYFFKDGDLYIDLKYDTGSMQFLQKKGETR